MPCEPESNLVCSESEADSGPNGVVDAMTNPQLLESDKEVLQNLILMKVCKIHEFYQRFQEGFMLISEIAESAEILKSEVFSKI